MRADLELHRQHSSLLPLFQDSFESVQTWIAEIRKHGPNDVVISLVGNKLDLAREDESTRAVKDGVRI